MKFQIKTFMLDAPKQLQDQMNRWIQHYEPDHIYSVQYFEYEGKLHAIVLFKPKTETE